MHPLYVASWSLMLLFCCFGPTMAEDPIIVHHSDPSLKRLEKQLGVTAAQRERFEDIVVKYRDPINNSSAANGNEDDTRPSGDQGQKHGRGRKSSTGIFGGGRRNTSRQEEDELATILTPEQIKQFEELNGKKPKGRAGANDK
jgi:Spy/CpxP family protein refolding chaperone